MSIILNKTVTGTQIIVFITIFTKTHENNVFQTHVQWRLFSTWPPENSAISREFVDPGITDVSIGC